MAIYCKEIRLLYISAWFSGCTSVEAFLIQHYGGVPLRDKHAPLSKVLKTLRRKKENANDLLKIINTRNPFDMMVTTYHKDRYRHYQMHLKSGKYPDWMWKGAQDRCTWAGENSVSFQQYLQKCSKEILPTNLIDDERFDNYIAFEHLQNDIDAVLAKIGITNKYRVPHLNKTHSREKDFRQYYDSDSKAATKPLVKRYLELTGYTFDSTPTGSRTPISGLRIQRPKPLDDRGKKLLFG